MKGTKVEYLTWFSVQKPRWMDLTLSFSFFFKLDLWILTNVMKCEMSILNLQLFERNCYYAYLFFYINNLIELSFFLLNRARFC